MGDCTCPRLNTIDPDRPILTEDNVHELMVSTFDCTAGTTVTVFCNEPTYIHEGDKTFTCQSNGRWSYQEEPRCIKQACPVVSSLSNIVVSTDRRDVGTKLTVTCRDGYMLHGDSIFTCTDNGWDFTTQPSCRVIPVDTEAEALDNNTKILLAVGISVSVIVIAAIVVILILAYRMKKRKKIQDSIDGSILGMYPQRSYRSSFRERSDIYAPESMEMSLPPPSYHSNPLLGLYSNYPLAYHDKHPYMQSSSNNPFQLPRLRPATREDEGKLRPLAGMLEEESPWPQIARPEVDRPWPLSHPLGDIAEEDDPYFLPDYLPDEPIRTIDRRVQRNYGDEYTVYRGSQHAPASHYQSLPRVDPRDSYRRAVHQIHHPRDSYHSPEPGVHSRDPYRRAPHPLEPGVHPRDSYRRAVHPSEAHAPPNNRLFRGTYPRDRF